LGQDPKNPTLGRTKKDMGRGDQDSSRAWKNVKSFLSVKNEKKIGGGKDGDYSKVKGG